MDSGSQEVVNLIDLLSKIHKNIESYLEVKLVYYGQEYEIRTDSIEGVHPDFNQKMKFTIKPNHGDFFTKDEIQNCNGGINFTLFDEIRNEEKIVEKDANIYKYKYEKKYLGNFFIPFSTIFQNAKFLETMSRINIPLSVIGYYSDSSTIFEILEEETKKKEENTGTKYDAFKEKDKDVRKIVNPNINSYISLYMSCDPILTIFKDEEHEYSLGFEDSKFLINSNTLLKNLKGRNPNLQNRNIRVFADNFNGNSVFIPRYLHPQKPPLEIFDKNDSNTWQLAIEKTSYYVSLIPFIEDCNAFDEMPECWCTDEEFFNFKFGDYEEHAILLCNYFNYIDLHSKRNVKSYLVLGKGFPEGNTIYVLRCDYDKNHFELWNAKNAECFYFDKNYTQTKCCFIPFGRAFNNISLSESICQLKEIGAIVTSENVYINIQNEVSPIGTDFNLNNRSMWVEFLNESSKKKYFPKGIKTIQKEIENEDPSPEDAYLITEEIFNYIKRQYIFIVELKLKGLHKSLREDH